MSLALVVELKMLSQRRSGTCFIHGINFAPGFLSEHLFLQVQVCSIDYSSEPMVVNLELLREVHHKFLELAAQAFSVQLVGLDQLPSDDERY